MKRLTCVSLAAATLLGASLITVSRAQAQDCNDFATSGGWIVPIEGVLANFGAGGGINQGQPLFGYLTYLDHRTAPPLMVSAQEVTGYCQLACAPEGCLSRQITYTNATVRVGNDVCTGVTVIVQVLDCGEPGTADTFAICILANDCFGGYCASGVLGGDNKPSGGNVQVHAADPSCGVVVPICEAPPTECTCLTTCILP